VSFVRDAFKMLGIDKPKSHAIFYKNGLKRFGSDFIDLMEIINSRNGGSFVDPYEKKNKSLELSIYVGSFFNYTKWESIFTWLEKENIDQPRKILDLGCECGITTCLLALMWPESEIIGIDACGPAIKCANNLSEYLNLKNIRFINCNLDKFSLSGSKFDLIFASFLTHEWLATNRVSPLINVDMDIKLENVKIKQTELIYVEKLATICNLLSTDGLFITIDRIPLIYGQYWYIKAAELAGLKFSIAKSYKIETKDGSESEKFPVNVFQRRKDDDRETHIDEVISLASFKNIPPLDLEDDIAEAFFRSFNKQEILFNSSIKYIDGSGVRYISLFRCGPILMRYDWTSLGYKHLLTFPLISLAEALNDCHTIIDQLDSIAEINSEITVAGLELLKSWGYSMNSVND